MATPVCTIDANGISAPTFQDCLTWLQSQYRAIYGSDVYLGNDSQDGQFLGVLAQAFHDVNSAAILVYQNFSPATAQGQGLSSQVKINGIKRSIATNSTVDLVLIGQAGTLIQGGVVIDANQNRWDIQDAGAIPNTGTLTVTAICEKEGAVEASANTINQIATPTRGWQSVTNPLAATPGDPVELDGQLRQRQALSVSIPSMTILKGIVGAIGTLPGVTRWKPYENDTNAADTNGLPAHSFAMVVEGGNALDIARVIAAKKAPGAYTHGTTAQVVSDPAGLNHTIRFFRPTVVAIKVSITIKAMLGYTSAIGVMIQNAVTAYINALNIGDPVLISKLSLPINLAGDPTDSATYDVSAIAVSRDANVPTSSNIILAFNEVALAGAVTLTVIT